ncbi:MAG: hypothetical protein OET79_10200 [Nitrospirota bacterium]|nr:hypothetical protein [Nitrospirota bacterium]
MMSTMAEADCRSIRSVPGLIAQAMLMAQAMNADQLITLRWGA